jgi:acetylornithine deacetylase/succinyl-diaminopimelate desuccinylase-like protein
MKETLRKGPPYPPVNLLLVGNEENGEQEPTGTPHVLAQLKEEWDGYEPAIFIAGEHTGEKGTELLGEVCTQNRGVLRFELVATGARAHSGFGGASGDLMERLLGAQQALQGIFSKHLTLKSADGWASQAKVSYVSVGTPGVFNITPERGCIGVEIRPIPQDDVSGLKADLEALAAERGLTIEPTTWEPGVACDDDNPYLLALLDAIRSSSGEEPRIGRKGAGTSARFAPRGQGVVWGQTGIGPHAKGERHYLPSIDPYYKALVALGKALLKG